MEGRGWRVGLVVSITEPYNIPCTCILWLCAGVAKAVDAVVEHLKKISRDVTTPEEITQVKDPSRLMYSVYACMCAS